MKQTQKRLLALVLAALMTATMIVPMTFSAAADAVEIPEDPISDDIVVSAGVVTNITWEPGYIGSPTNAYAGPWATASSSWNSSYRRTEVFTVPKAGTTLTWSESTVKGAQSNGALVVSSWTLQEDGTYVVDTEGAYVAGGGKTTTNNYYYDSSAATMTYLYTTTKDNEHLRLGIYGGKSDNTWTANSGECPTVYVKSFDDTISVTDGNVTNITWETSYTASRNHGSKSEGTVVSTSWSTAYRETAIFTVPQAGTTLTWTESSVKGAQSNAAYLVSSWKPTANGGYVFDATGDNLAGVGKATSDHVLYDADAATLTYTYTTGRDNEHLRFGIYGGTAENTWVANSAACPTVSVAYGNVLAVNWNQGYVGSVSNVQSGQAWNIVTSGSGWASAYRYTDVVTVPQAGTTLVWQEYASSSSYASSYNAFVLSSWKKDENGDWVPDYSGAAILGDGVSIVGAQYYDSTRKTVTYTYTTTKANETLRFGCYGRLTDALTSASAQCPVIRMYTPTFSDGTVSDVAWFNGYVGVTQDVKSSGSDSTARSYTYFKKGTNAYVYSAPIRIPYAGTTVSFTDSAASYCSASAYAISVWEPAKDGELNLIYGMKGGSSGPHISVDGSNYTYHYTSSHDGEIIRLCYRSDSVTASDNMTAVSYVANDSAHYGTLALAGYRSGYAGENYRPDVTFTVTDGVAVSAAFTVFAPGTVISFTDPAGFAGAGVDAFTSGTRTISATKAFEQGVGGYRDNADGSRTYYFVTVAATTSLVIRLNATGNTDKTGDFVAPLVRTVASAAGDYDILQGKTIYAIGDSYFAGNSIDRTSVWMNRMAREYDMKLVNYGISGSTVTAKGTMEGYASGSNPMVTRYTNMPDDDSAALVIFEGGRNDYNAGADFGTIGEESTETFYGSLKIVIDGLLEKYPNALLICVTPWDLTDYGSVHNEGKHQDYANAFVRLVDTLYSENDRVQLIPTYDSDQFPVYMLDSTFRSAYCMHPTDISHLHATGHLYALPYFEEAIAALYADFLNVNAETNITLSNGGVQVLQQSTGTAGQIVMPTVNSAYFVGWGATVNGSPVLLPAGATWDYTADANYTFNAIYLHMTTRRAAQVRMTTGSTGLRFITDVTDLDEWTALTETAAAVYLGTLIVPYRYVKEIGGQLTHAALDAASKQRLDVRTAGFYAEDEDSAMFVGSVANIKQQNYTLAYTARGYAKIRYTNGETVYLYADNGGRFTRTVFDVATAAYNDTANAPDSTHTIERGDGKYVAYTAEQGAVLESFIEAPLVKLVSNGPAANAYLNLQAGQGLTATVVSATHTSMIDEDGNITASAAGNPELFAAYIALTGETNATGFFAVTLGGLEAYGATMDGRAYTVNCVRSDGKLIIPFFEYTASY